MYPKSMFLAKIRKNYNFSSENKHFYSREILLYIAWARFHNVLLVVSRCNSFTPFWKQKLGFPGQGVQCRMGLVVNFLYF